MEGGEVVLEGSRRRGVIRFACAVVCCGGVANGPNGFVAGRRNRLVGAFDGPVWKSVPPKICLQIEMMGTAAISSLYAAP